MLVEKGAPFDQLMYPPCTSTAVSRRSAHRESHAEAVNVFSVFFKNKISLNNHVNIIYFPRTHIFLTSKERSTALRNYNIILYNVTSSAGRLCSAKKRDIENFKKKKKTVNFFLNFEFLN